MTLCGRSVKFFAALTIAFAAFHCSHATPEHTEIILAESDDLEFAEEELRTCGENQFECRNRECIPSDLLCDGKADCLDQSDETRSECTRPELACPNRAFRCDYGACVHENAICNGVKDCLDNSDELLPECPRASPSIGSTVLIRIFGDDRDQRRISSRRRLYRVTIPRPETSTPIPGRLRPTIPLRPPPFLTPLTAPRSETSLTSTSSFCVVPPQPLYGRWRLHRKFCRGNQHCEVLQGISLPRDSQLVYSCAGGFMVRGSSNVYCQDGGSWSPIPSCVVTTCTPLNSMSRAATCSRFGDRVSCRHSLLPYTRAKVTCRINYGLEGTFITGLEQDVQCNVFGRWEPEPISCGPVCGIVNIPGQGNPTANNIPPDLGPFPWHANLWREVQTPRGTELEFRCSATIVQTNFVVTAAHCVIDERTGLAEDPKRLRVTSGKNSNGESDVLQTSVSIEQKVKAVYRYCEYFGLARGYATDIAMIELEGEFEFSPVILPACLDVSSTSEQNFIPGTAGRIDGFGRRSASTPSPILQNVKVTYVSNPDCRLPYHPSQRRPVIRHDEFCGVYSNDTTICNWDNGGGFVSQKDGLWHLMGIFIRDLGGARAVQRACGENPYSLYTKVSLYMPWIQDVMFQSKHYQSSPVCSFDLRALLTMSTTTTTTTTTTSRPTTTTTSRPTTTTTSRPTTTPQTEIPSVVTTEMSTTKATQTTTAVPVEIRTAPSTAESSCLVPEQPANGEWKLHPDLCNDTNCHVPKGVLLGPGSQLVYTCASGFRLKGNPEVFCRAKGRWSSIPECIEIRCNSLESISRMITCYRSNNWAPCNSTLLPKTRVVITCRVGYREDSNSLKIGDRTVECNENGEWEPNPITCLPVCGVKNTRVTPTVVNGTAADISEYPWHATLYEQMNTTQGSKEFICGATIIQNNLLLTAAHCVYDDVFKTVRVPEKFSVAAGNRFRDYDSPLHDPRVVQKSTVKNIYVPCDYYGLEGNYASDIAIIELREPFQLSDILLPACLDVLGNNEQILEPGSVGQFAGFGRTATGMSSGILLETMIPYVSYSQCKMSQKAGGNVALIVQDKFCGGNTQGMAVCTGDSGGGLTFDNNGVSNVMGILSVNLGADTSTGERTCDQTAFSLYTKVSNHMAWIRNVMSHLERGRTYPSCGSQ